MGELVKAGELDGKIQYAETLSKAGMLPAAYRNNPGNVLWAIEYGAALGVPPVVAIGLVHVIDGKPVASAALISSLVRKGGHRLRVEGSAESATAEIVRSDDPDFAFTFTFTLADAKKAGIDRNPTWSRYPQAMLQARAITACARMACPEVLSGLLYTPEELGADVDAAGNPVNGPQVSDKVWNDKDRIDFERCCKAWGVNSEEVAAWCESIGQPRPEYLPQERRFKLKSGLAPDGRLRKQFDEWLAQQMLRAVDAAVVNDDAGFLED